MGYRILLTDNFKKEAKKLSKKFASLKSDLSWLLEELEEDPFLGTDLGNNVFKIRLAITSKGKGKSGGGRIISYVQIVEEIVFLVAIYDKSKRANISKNDISKILKEEGLI